MSDVLSPFLTERSLLSYSPIGAYTSSFDEGGAILEGLYNDRKPLLSLHFQLLPLRLLDSFQLKQTFKHHPKMSYLTQNLRLLVCKP